jgi:hypothetical protein
MHLCFARQLPSEPDDIDACYGAFYGALLASPVLPELQSHSPENCRMFTSLVEHESH